MQEIKDQKESKFDYSLVSNEDADFLKQRINKIQNILQSDATKVGEQFYLAQQRLATYGHGTFRSWIESLKISKDSVYRYINRYSFIANCDNQNDIETFESLQKSLTYDVSKPSAPREAVQKVLDGDITTHKEYKELERKLKMAQEENADKDLQIKRLNNRPEPEPRVVEKTVTKEVTPSDYDELKREVTVTNDLRQRNNQLQEQIDSLQSNLSKMTEQNGEYEDLQKKIDALEKQKSDVRKSIDTGANIMYLNDQLKEMFDTKLSTLRYQNLFADDPIMSAVEHTEELLDTLQAFIDDMRRILPQHDRKIIEGEFSE